MPWLMLLTSGLRSLRANKLRSLLAITGLTIGIAAVITMIALGSGARDAVLAQTARFGTNILMVRVAATKPGERPPRLQPADATAILAVPGVHRVSPLVYDPAIVVKNGARSYTSRLVGAAPSYRHILYAEMAEGDFFSQADCDRAERVVVLGSNVKHLVFGDAPAAGRPVLLNDRPYRVAGVLEAKGENVGWNPDNWIVVPLDTAMRRVRGIDYVEDIAVQSDPAYFLGDVDREIHRAMRQSRGLTGERANDFTVRSALDAMMFAEQMLDIFTGLIAGIALVSLFVGGIGIMNVMVVSVTERTREIGIRKALGARDEEIMGQFLIEACLVSSCGGLFGVAMGWVFTAGARFLLQYTPVPFSPQVGFQPAVMAVIVSMAVGIFFGYYPARRAASLDPVESLRYE